MVHNATLCTVGCTCGLHSFLPAFLPICIVVSCTSCKVSVQISIIPWCLVKCWPYPSCGACSSPLLMCNLHCCLCSRLGNDHALYCRAWRRVMRLLPSGRVRRARPRRTPPQMVRSVWSHLACNSATAQRHSWISLLMVFESQQSRFRSMAAYLEP